MQERKRKLGNMRSTTAARWFKFCKLYTIYRYVLFKLGYENPFVCVVKVTSRCNLHCSHCAWQKNTTPDLQTADICAKIKNAYQQGCEAVVFEGGEPTLRSDLNELVKFAKDLGLITFLVTNGQKEFSSYDVDSIWVSVEGTDQAQARIRGEGSLERILDNLKKAVDKNIIILMTISKTNFQDIGKIPVIFKKQLIWYNFLYPYHDIKDEHLANHEIVHTAREIWDLKKVHKNILNSKAYLKNAGRRVCCDDFWTYTIDSAGREQIGCTVAQIERPDCNHCFMVCNAEPYHALRLKFDSLRFLYRISGRKLLTKF